MAKKNHMAKAKRPPKRDTFTRPDATAMDTLAHYALAPFDNECRAMDRKWGVDRLPELVSPELASIWGRTVANLNDAIEAAYGAEDADQARANIVACVESCLRGFKAMDEAATTNGSEPADPTVIEAEIDGYRFAILPDDAAWPALKEKRPDLVTVSLRDVALALQLYEGSKWAVEEVRKSFPKAELVSVNPNTPLVDDEIKF